MAVVNGPGVVKLPVGKRTKIGTITTATDILQFAISENSGFHLGSLILQAVPNGTVTTFTIQMQFSLDGGTTFGTQLNVNPATIASTTTAANMLFGTATPMPLLNVAIPGVGGEVSLQLATQSLTLGTATKIDIWGLVA